MIQSRSNFEFTPQLKQDIRRAVRMLDGRDVTFEELADFYLKAKRPTSRKFVSEVAELFTASRIADGLRRATLDWYEEHLRYICHAFGHRLMDEVTRGEFRTWLDDLEHKPASKAATARCARALWFWGMEQDPPLATENVTIGMKFSVKPNQGDGSEKFLSVEKCEAIMHNVPLVHRSAIALMLFAGMRPEEVAGEGGKDWLLWKHIDFEGKTIRVPATIAKTTQGRLIEGIPETVWHFLVRGSPDTPVTSIQRRSLLLHVQAAGGFAKGEWPQDALRHTCATYAVAELTDLTFVSHWLGNSVPVLRRNYVGLVVKSVAARFWAIRPK